jgi:hypothetical protein
MGIVMLWTVGRTPFEVQYTVGSLRYRIGIDPTFVEAAKCAALLVSGIARPRGRCRTAARVRPAKRLRVI